MFKGLAQVGIIFFRDLLIHRSLLLFYVMMAVGEKYIYIYIYIYIYMNCLLKWSARIHDENLFNSFLIIHYCVPVSGLHLLRQPQLVLQGQICL